MDAPIHGHAQIKKTIALQLLSGVAKDLDNGTRLHDDINIQIVGDPSCGKSRLLRGVMNVCNLVKAGAMVLFDGGTVFTD